MIFTRAKKCHNIRQGGVGRKPQRFFFGVQHNRTTRMANGLHDSVGSSGQQGKGPNALLADGIVPFVPNSSKGKGALFIN